MELYTGDRINDASFLPLLDKEMGVRLLFCPVDQAHWTK